MGRTNQITITNERGRLSPDQIDRMVNDAAKYQEEDERIRERIEVKNKLEAYCYQLKNSVNEMKDKFQPGDFEKADKEIQAMFQWLEDNQEAEKDEYTYKESQLDSVVRPLLVKAYQGGDGGFVPPDEKNNMFGRGPKVEEVD